MDKKLREELEDKLETFESLLSHQNVLLSEMKEILNLFKFSLFSFCVGILIVLFFGIIKWF